MPQTATATVTVLFPRALRQYCEGKSEITCQAPSVRGALTEVERQHPDLYSCICDETGKVRKHINLFVNTSHIRDLEGIDTQLKPGDEIMVLPAVSGG